MLTLCILKFLDFQIWVCAKYKWKPPYKWSDLFMWSADQALGSRGLCKSWTLDWTGLWTGLDSGLDWTLDWTGLWTGLDSGLQNSYQPKNKLLSKQQQPLMKYTVMNTEKHRQTVLSSTTDKFLIMKTNIQFSIESQIPI